MSDSALMSRSELTSPDIPMSWVLTRRDRLTLLAQIGLATEVVFDLETTGLHEHATTGGDINGGVGARIVLASFTLPIPDHGTPITYIVPLSHPQSPYRGTWRRLMRHIASEIRDTARPLVGHNVKFDARWIYATTGVDLAHLIAWDTAVSSHLLDENSSRALKERAPATFGIERWDDHDLTYPGAAEDVDLFELGEYAAKDTYWTWRLLENHREQLSVTGRREELHDPEEITLARVGRVASWVAMPTVASLTKMEQRGFSLDTDWVKETLAQSEEAMTTIGKGLATRFEGLDPDHFSMAPTSKWFAQWTQTAVEEGELKVIALTRTGKPQWDYAALSRLERTGYPLAGEILEYRKHTKRAEYLRSWLGLVSSDGAIHSNYNPGTVVTGRLSSDSPNMQQINYHLRPAFVPRPGYVIADIDYSQIELRVAAFVSRCAPMIEAFQRGDDLHTLLAAQILSVSQGRAVGPEEVTGEDRQAAKSANFGLLYGMAVEGYRSYAETAYGVQVSYDEAQQIYDTFFATWDGMRQWHNRMIDLVRRQGYVTSPIGRIRRLPGIWDASPALNEFSERAAINSPVQGFASDLLQMALASIQGVLPGSRPVVGAYPVATVHDSIAIEVQEDRWEEITRECIGRMVNLAPVLARMDCQMDVPLAAEAQVGTRWGLADVGEIR